MKFFPYPITSANLAEFTRQGSGLFASIVKAEFDGDPVHLAGNNFIAVIDLLAIETPSHPAKEFPAAASKILSLPWDVFNNRPDHHTHRADGRECSSWVSFDDHSGDFPKHRHLELFKRDGRVNLMGWYSVGQGRVAVPPQVLNLARKLPRARFWSPPLSHYGGFQKFLPVRYNGGLALIGSLSEAQQKQLPRLGGICCQITTRPITGKLF